MGGTTQFVSADQSCVKQSMASALALKNLALNLGSFVFLSLANLSTVGVSSKKLHIFWNQTGCIPVIKVAYARPKICFLILCSWDPYHVDAYFVLSGHVVNCYGYVQNIWFHGASFHYFDNVFTICYPIH